MDFKNKLYQQISTLLDSQKLAALSTSRDDHPYTSLVAFSNTSDLAWIVFATPETTRKFENLTRNPRVSLLMNSSMNRVADIHEAAAVTAIGDVHACSPADMDRYRGLYLDKHPHMKEFIAAQTTVLVCVRVKTYFYVERFQNVSELRMP